MRLQSRTLDMPPFPLTSLSISVADKCHSTAHIHQSPPKSLIILIFFQPAAFLILLLFSSSTSGVFVPLPFTPLTPSEASFGGLGIHCTGVVVLKPFSPIQCIPAEGADVAGRGVGFFCRLYIRSSSLFIFSDVSAPLRNQFLEIPFVLVATCVDIICLYTIVDIVRPFSLSCDSINMSWSAFA